MQAKIAQASKGGMYAAGLAGEGWDGGYLAALNDVLLALNGVIPDNNLWHDDDDQDPHP
jgi:hypothetical protein